MAEILAQGGFVELGKKLRLHRDVEATDLVNQLTFIHGVFTFTKTGVYPRRSWHRSAADGVIKIGYSLRPT